MDEDIWEIQPQKLNFIFKPNTKIRQTVKLINKSDRHIAFRVYLTHVQLYGFRPTKGIIKPGSSYEVKVTRKAQDVAPVPEMVAEERLYFKQIFVPEDTDTKDIVSIFDCQKCKSDINRKKLKVVVDVIPESEETASKIEEQDLKMKEDQQNNFMKLKIEELDSRLKDAEKTISKLKEHEKDYEFKGKKRYPCVFINCFNLKLV